MTWRGTRGITLAELRQDIVTGQWVVVATARAMRPTDFSAPCYTPEAETGDCPFCPGNETMTPLELVALRAEDTEPDAPGWQVRVVPNRFPAFEPGEKAKPSSGIFPRRPAEGSHEVIIHTPEHGKSLASMSVEEVSMVLGVYRDRYLLNREDPDVRYIHIIVNHGRESGASIEHSHSQLFGMPLVPPLVQQELAGASWRSTREGSCVFCDIISEEARAGVRVIRESDEFVAIAPFASRFPFEVWIVPRTHQESFDLITGPQIWDFASVLRDVLGRYHMRFSDPPYNYFIHSAPCDGSRYPYYHWHLEMIPRLTVPGAMELGTSMWINITTPEHAADYLTGKVDQGL